MILHPYLIRWRTDTTTFLKRTFVKPTWDWMCVLSLQWHSMSFTMVPRSSSTIDAWSYAEIVKGEYTFYLQHHHHRMINYLTHIIFKDLGLLSRMTSAKPAVVKAKWKGIARKKNRYVACERCRGSGKIKVRKSCTVCNGLRYTESKESATIIIPKGGPPTGKICLTNKGHETVRMMDRHMDTMQTHIYPIISFCLFSMVHDHVAKWVMSLWVSTWLDIVILSCTTTNAILSPSFRLHWVKHYLDSTRSYWRIWMDAKSRYPIPLAMSLIHHQKSISEVKECPSHMIHHARATWLSSLMYNSLAGLSFHPQIKISLPAFSINNKTFPRCPLNAYLKVAMIAIVLQQLPRRHPPLMLVALLSSMNELLWMTRRVTTST